MDSTNNVCSATKKSHKTSKALLPSKRKRKKVFQNGQQNKNVLFTTINICKNALIAYKSSRYFELLKKKVKKLFLHKIFLRTRKTLK